MDKFLSKTTRPSVTSRQGHLTAKDRAREYPTILYEDGGLLFCRPCNITINHVRSSTIKDHFACNKHITKKREYDQRNEPETSRKKQATLDSVILSKTESSRARNELLVDVVEAFASANIPLERLNNPAVKSFLERRVPMEGRCRKLQLYVP